VLFGFLMARLGLIPALIAVLSQARRAAASFSFHQEVLVLTVVMSVFAVLVLLYVLKMPIPSSQGTYGYLSNLAFGFGVAFSLQNLRLLLHRVVLGTLIACCRASALVASGCCFRLPSRCRRLRRSSCSRGSTTGRSTAVDQFDPRPPSGGDGLAVTVWDGYQMARPGAARGLRLRSRRSRRFSRVASGRFDRARGSAAAEWALLFGARPNTSR